MQQILDAGRRYPMVTLLTPFFMTETTDTIRKIIEIGNKFPNIIPLISVFTYKTDEIGLVIKDTGLEDFESDFCVISENNFINGS